MAVQDPFDSVEWDKGVPSVEELQKLFPKIGKRRIEEEVEHRLRKAEAQRETQLNVERGLYFVGALWGLIIIVIATYVGASILHAHKNLVKPL
jgi:hypothetical protein